MAVRLSRSTVPIVGSFSEQPSRQDDLMRELTRRYQERDIDLALSKFMDQNNGEIPRTVQEFDSFHRNLKAGLEEDLQLTKDELRMKEEQIEQLTQEIRKLKQRQQYQNTGQP